MKSLSPKLKLIFLKTGCLFLLSTLTCAFAEPPPSTVIPVDRNNMWQEVFKSEQEYVFMAFTHSKGEKAGKKSAEKDCPAANHEAKEPQGQEHCKQLHETLNKLAHQHAGKVKFVKLDIETSPLITREFRKLLRVNDETFVCIVLRVDSQIAGKALAGEPSEEAMQQLIDDVVNKKIKLTKPTIMQSIRLKLFLDYLWNKNGILDQTAQTLKDIALPPSKK